MRLAPTVLTHCMGPTASVRLTLSMPSAAVPNTVLAICHTGMALVASFGAHTLCDCHIHDPPQHITFHMVQSITAHEIHVLTYICVLIGAHYILQAGEVRCLARQHNFGARTWVASGDTMGKIQLLTLMLL
jgi:hypothetical protein